jgi:hypothetical protein
MPGSPCPPDRAKPRGTRFTRASHKGGRESCGDRGQHSIEILQDLVVAEAKHAIAFAFQKMGARRIIVQRLAMLAAVDLDDEPAAV